MPKDGLRKWERYALKKLAQGLCRSCTREREDKTKGLCDVCLEKMRIQKRRKSLNSKEP